MINFVFFLLGFFCGCIALCIVIGVALKIKKKNDLKAKSVQKNTGYVAYKKPNQFNQTNKH